MSQNRNKSLGTLGLAMKSGNVASGEFLTEQAIRAGTAKLVIVAEDASDNTKKKFRNSCLYYQIPLAIQFNKDTLGKAIGKEFRASLAILDPGFALSISKNLELEEM
ncbi:MAG: ribosomal L7Ae/L30e/S12e/Gadd45 family protein [Clostridiales bacterium]|nr:ribosomal L7Ae/L30e/S12e/Gadd45 family protein [Clostridiales bacterium]